MQSIPGIITTQTTVMILDFWYPEKQSRIWLFFWWKVPNSPNVSFLKKLTEMDSKWPTKFVGEGASIFLGVFCDLHKKTPMYVDGQSEFRIRNKHSFEKLNLILKSPKVKIVLEFILIFTWNHDLNISKSFVLFHKKVIFIKSKLASQISISKKYYCLRYTYKIGTCKVD